EPTGAIPAWPEPARSVPAVPARDATPTPAPPAPRRTSPVTVVAVAVAALAVAALAFVLLTGDDSTPSSEPRAALAGDAAATPEPEATVAVTAEPDAAAQDEEVDAVATEEPVEDAPAEDPPPAPTTRVVKGDGYEFTVPKGAGWSLGRRETGSSGRLFRRELTGPDGIVILIVHTPDDPARPDPSTVVRRRGLDAQATDAARLTLQDFPTDECEGRRCDDFVLNDPAFGGLAILANGTGSEPAAVAARDIARSVVAG
ncbi:MAG TPA: hypothetical protein VFM58_06045, partial [Solirubrobacteraceae bacterium]|nr:hypothetical protein [Solirubrobacteraceae bacterium]